MAKIRIKNLVVWVYAFLILALGIAFLFQSSKLGAETPKTIKYIIANEENLDLQEEAPVLQEKEVLFEEVTEPVYSYVVVSQSSNPKVNIGERFTLSVKIRNTGNVALFSNGENPLYLGSSHSMDRISVFYQEKLKGWFSANRITADKKIIRPGEMTNFTFQMEAPESSGIYREFFTPVLEGVKWMIEEDILWEIEVKDPENPDEKLAVIVDGKPEKYIKIKISEQILYAYDNGIEKYAFQTSTGKEGMNTPAGIFQIYNKFPVQYSAPYELFMDNWMAITQNGLYGIHSLPYWKLKNGGRLYEGEDHLGSRVSHGCIRVSLENSQLLFDWAEVGMPIYIED